QFHIMPIGPCDDQAEGYAVRLGQQTAFDPAFGAVGRIGARFFPRPVALSSSPHPDSTSASLVLAIHQIVPPRLATTAKTRRPEPTAEIDHGRWNAGITPWHLTPSTDSRCAARRKSHRRTGSPGCEVCLRQSDACLHAGATLAPRLPTIHLKLESLSSLCSPGSVAASF